LKLEEDGHTVRMRIDWLTVVKKKRSTGWAATLRHLGVFGLFSFAILDSLPVPTFGGPDILIAVLAASHRDPWYEYAAAATAGSLIGAFITFRLARKAGMEYLNKHFAAGRLPRVLKLFERWGTGALAVSAAVPFPSPTTVFFAAAGASGYSTRKYLIVVGLCRAARYSLIAILADHYGRHFTRVIRHPVQYWGWFLLIALLIAGGATGAVVINRRMETSSSAD
jgi:membrane protein YqaA with SNARE-associated domain